MRLTQWLAVPVAEFEGRQLSLPTTRAASFSVVFDMYLSLSGDTRMEIPASDLVGFFMKGGWQWVGLDETV